MWDSASSSTTLTSVAFYKVFKACFVQLWGHWSWHPSPKIQSADNIMIFNFVASVTICCGQPWRFSMMNGYKLLMLLFTYASCTLQSHLAAVYLDDNWLTSSCMLLRILAAFRFMDIVWTCVLGHILGSYIGSVVVDWPVSVKLLRPSGRCIGWSTCQLARLWSTHPLLRCSWSNDLQVSKRSGRW